jgi:hypothetical protein
MVNRTPYRQQKTEQHQNTMTRKERGNNGGQNTIETTKTGQHQNTMTRKEEENNGEQNTI